MFHHRSTLLIFFVVSYNIVCTLGRRPSRHFGLPCQLCECFVEYTDRDVSQFAKPYKVVNGSLAYDTTEDHCLAQCLKEQKCAMAIYGYVGGRKVFACEFYEETNTRGILYTPYTNIYIKRSSECRKSEVPFPNTGIGYGSMEMADADENVFNRKMRYVHMFQKFNFFGFG